VRRPALIRAETNMILVFMGEFEFVRFNPAGGQILHVITARLRGVHVAEPDFDP
jgi:hypothetical protein